MSVHGQPSWYDLYTTDVDSSRSFYTAVVGWTTTTWADVAPEPYEMWTAGEQPVGGMAALPKAAREMGAPPHWIAYFGTDDLAASIAHASQLGATLRHGPETIPEVGQIAIVSDPQGATFALFQPAADRPASTGGPGHFSWHELSTSDQAGAIAFYTALLGWKEASSMDMGPMGTYWMFHNGGPPLGGMMTRPPEMPVSSWLYYISVADLDAALARVSANGGKVINGPMEVPGGDRVAQCTDPQGAMFALHSNGTPA